VQTEQPHLEHEPQPQLVVREVVDAQEMVAIRPMHAASWLATYPNESAGVSLG
jgi:hypothetical protein